MGYQDLGDHGYPVGAPQPARRWRVWLPVGIVLGCVAIGLAARLLAGPFFTWLRHVGVDERGPARAPATAPPAPGPTTPPAAR